MRSADQADGSDIAGGRRNLAERTSERGADARQVGRRGMRALGAAVSRVAAPIVAKRGGGMLARLKAEWPEILGDRWAARSWPTALGRDGALTLRIDSAAAALELQHRTPLVIERINLFLGRAAVSRLKLVQGPLPLPPPPDPPAPRTLGPGAADMLDARLSDVAAPELRTALARLGRAVLAEQEPASEPDIARRHDPN